MIDKFYDLPLAKIHSAILHHKNLLARDYFMLFFDFAIQLKCRFTRMKTLEISGNNGGT